MFSSGSTWLFNTVLEIAATIDAEPPRSRFVTVRQDLAGLGTPGEAGTEPRQVVKSHHLVPEVRAAAERLSDAIFVTVRDPRDAVVSLMQHQRYQLAVALAHVRRSAESCTMLAADPRTLLLHYENGFTDDPGTLDRIAAHLGGRLTPADRDRIFRNTRREAVEGLIARLAELPTTVRDVGSGDVYDRRTHWHRHHAGRDGRTGRWTEMLLPAHAAVVEHQLSDWMPRFGYHPACALRFVRYVVDLGRGAAPSRP